MMTSETLIVERFGSLTEIQKKAIPVIAEGANALLIAPTGHGKTEAALLPVLEGIKEKPGISALYITPLRSLNRDLLSRFHYWCEKLAITRDIRHGDTPQSARTRHRRKPPQIVLTTIESLQALLVAPVMRSHLKNVRYVIVDEVHDILDNKRGAQLSLSLERLEEIANFKRVGISATLPNPHEAAALLFGDRDYKVIEGGRAREMEIKIEYLSDKEKRLERLKELAEANRALIFVNTRSTAEEIGAWLKEKGAPIEVHHGSLSKEVRIAAEDRFKSGEIKSLLCTSSLELGIDVGDVDLVVQYGSPHQVFRLIQRVGRSGHSTGRIPKGTILPVDFDDLLESEALVSLMNNGWMEKKIIEKGALDVIAHQLVGILLERYTTRIEDIHKILSRSAAYGISLEKLRAIVLQLYAEGLLFINKDEALRARRRARKYYYSYLSTIPKTKRFLLRDSSSNRAIASLDEDFVASLNIGDEFLAKGQVWEVLDVTDEEVLATPGSGLDITVPSWVGEDIPVAREVAEAVGVLRRNERKEGMLPDDKNIVMEVVNDLVVIHSCFGSRINETIARAFAHRLSEYIGESVRTAADPYRVMIKCPFPIKGKKLLEVFSNLRDVRTTVEQSLRNSMLLRMKFTHVARMFGLVEEDAMANQKFIDALRYSVVYEEAVRSITFRYFDVKGAAELLEKTRKGEKKLILDERKEPSFFATIGLTRVSAKEAVGMFEPRERMIAALKEKVLSRAEELVCLNCGATRYLYLASATDNDLKCSRCGERALAPKHGREEESEHAAALIRNYGKRALIALSIYGIGPATAERILAKLHRDENSFYLDLINAQKMFVKTKKYWKA
ncbi:MAG: DEAD/DEAH box helicase [Candidatus Bilamarchaeaceae archaeon]